MEFTTLSAITGHLSSKVLVGDKPVALIRAISWRTREISLYHQFWRRIRRCMERYFRYIRRPVLLVLFFELRRSLNACFWVKEQSQPYNVVSGAELLESTYVSQHEESLTCPLEWKWPVDSVRFPFKWKSIRHTKLLGEWSWYLFQENRCVLCYMCGKKGGAPPAMVNGRFAV